MFAKKINNYLLSGVNTPFFLAIGDNAYSETKMELSRLGFSFLKVSDFCWGDDKLPNMDALIEVLSNDDQFPCDSKIAVLGIGEYLSLCGERETMVTLTMLKDLNIKGKKVILLLRGVTRQVQDLGLDPRFDGRRHLILDNIDYTLEITFFTPRLGNFAVHGVKNMLRVLEAGDCQNLKVTTSAKFPDSLICTRKISSAYEAIQHLLPNFNLSQSNGNEEQWMELLQHISKEGNSIENVFKQLRFNTSIQSEFYERIQGVEWENWAYYIFLKLNINSIQNRYLRLVLDNTIDFSDFKSNVLGAIIEVPIYENNYDLLYKDRKILVANFPESYIADFVVNNRRNYDESIYRLTDGTVTEKQEIIAWVSQYAKFDRLGIVYPALESYLKKYTFRCGDISELLTEYFHAYKMQKVLNKLDSEFLSKVDEFAKQRRFNRLQTRNEMLDKLDKSDTFLYWIDALGVEYLSYITDLANTKGLSVSIGIARAELPTITSINRNFYDSWPSQFKEKCEDLDLIKHSNSGGYNFQNNELPIHLSQELEVIEKALDKAATDLGLRRFKRFIITSDHGASRLAVLRKKEEKYDTDTKGEHSGRCCKLFEPYDLPFAAEENGYIVLADYGRFKGSRAANVEVHGGASLEEVVVPLIVLQLKDVTMKVELLEDTITTEFNKGISLTLFSNYVCEDIGIEYCGERYGSTKGGPNHYKINIPVIKRAGVYLADIYVGDNFVKQISLNVVGKSAKINSDFDDLF